METKKQPMGRYRAIMTTTDRERIAGEADVEPNKRHQSVSRVRSRIEELEHDAALLEEHHPDLYRELREAVCDDV